MPTDSTDVLRLRFLSALAVAHSAGRGNPRPIEESVRAYARSQRENGVGITSLLIEVKRLIQEQAGKDAPVFTPRVVGWAVAGFYAGTSPRAH